MVAIVHGGGGIQAVFGSVIAASLIGLLITPLFSKIIRFFPPVVTGTVITTIGLTLMPVAANWAMGGNQGGRTTAAWPTSAWPPPPWRSSCC